MSCIVKRKQVALKCLADIVPSDWENCQQTVELAGKSSTKYVGGCQMTTAREAQL